MERIAVAGGQWPVAGGGVEMQRPAARLQEPGNKRRLCRCSQTGHRPLATGHLVF